METIKAPIRTYMQVAGMNIEIVETTSSIDAALYELVEKTAPRSFCATVRHDDSAKAFGYGNTPEEAIRDLFATMASNALKVLESMRRQHGCLHPSEIADYAG